MTLRCLVMIVTVLLGAFSLRAGSVTSTTDMATISVVYGATSLSYTGNVDAGGGFKGWIWVAETDANNSWNTGSSIVLVRGGVDTPQAPTDVSGTRSIADGHWYVVMARKDTSGNDLVSYDAHWFQAGAGAKKKFRVDYDNTAGVPVRVRLVQNGSQLPGTVEVTLQPGEGIHQTFEVDDGATVTMQILVDDVTKDGPSWVSQDGAVTVVDAGTANPIETDDEFEIPKIDIVNDPAKNLPVNPVTPNQDKTIWDSNSSVSTGLETGTYREGVDKIVSALKVINDNISGTTVTPVSAPVPNDADAPWKPNATVNANALGKLPTAPTLNSTLTPSHTFGIHLEIPKPGGGNVTFDKTIDFSAAPWATPIGIFRALMLVVVTYVFFLASFWAVRGAFAGK